MTRLSGDEHRNPVHHSLGRGGSLRAPHVSRRASLSGRGAPGVVAREQARARRAGQSFQAVGGGRDGREVRNACRERRTGEPSTAHTVTSTGCIILLSKFQTWKSVWACGMVCTFVLSGERILGVDDGLRVVMDLERILGSALRQLFPAEGVIPSPYV